MEQPVEATQTFPPPIERSRLLVEKFGKFIIPVNTKPAKVLRDALSASNIFPADLPIVGGDVYSPEATEIFARVLAKTDEPSKIKYLCFKTEPEGRSHYFYPTMFRVKDGPVMSTIMTKGSGSLDALETTGSPFSDYVGGEIAGAATINDLRLDAKISKRLHQAGIRTRVALGVFLLEEIEYKGKVYTSDELVKEGIIKNSEDLPGLGVFASRTEFRIQNLADFFRDANLTSPETEALITYFIRTLEFDQSLEFKLIYEKYKGLVGKSSAMTSEERKAFFIDYFSALAKVFGEQAAKFEKIKAIMDMRPQPPTPSDEEYITAHNVSCLGEIVDNSGIKFEASASDIAGFQNSLCDVLLFALKTIDYGSSWEDVKTLERSVGRRFIDGYLDEIEPKWKNLSIPQGFLEDIRDTLDVSEDDTRRAYWITEIKSENFPLGRVSSFDLSEVTNELTNLSYGLLSHVLPHEKITRFLKEFVEVKRDPLAKVASREITASVHVPGEKGSSLTITTTPSRLAENYSRLCAEIGPPMQALHREADLPRFDFTFMSNTAERYFMTRLLEKRDLTPLFLKVPYAHKCGPIAVLERTENGRLELKILEGNLSRVISISSSARHPLYALREDLPTIKATETERKMILLARIFNLATAHAMTHILQDQLSIKKKLEVTSRLFATGKWTRDRKTATKAIFGGFGAAMLAALLEAQQIPGTQIVAEGGKYAGVLASLFPLLRIYIPTVTKQKMRLEEGDVTVIPESSSAPDIVARTLVPPNFKEKLGIFAPFEYNSPGTR